ncbi:MAG: alpha/beta hydrolase [SAR86 cluster bacterium]|uniref:Alpha/beta hydrolase n=1 Tax=SAR86 cluster bacterium TaxID=2030880 RepID=A0A2A5B7T9_9GAMM|nr:MAG: alpha/beta hydrolase [SAR86 cluster bacterium]
MAARAQAQRNPAERNVFVSHKYEEQKIDLGEMEMNYVVVGSPDKPALLLIPGQTESWWGYEDVLELLSTDFQCYAVDLRGQGRSTWTPGRYTLDNMGNDLVRFIDEVIGRPVVVSGCSSGGVLSAWLSAYAKPGQIRGAMYEDPPLFSSELSPFYGQSIRQSRVGEVFHLNTIYLGDQWKIGDWEARMRAVGINSSGEPPQNLLEYDPEWGRAFWEGTVAASCPHHIMLSKVKVPVQLTHHARRVDSSTGMLSGAMSDLQAQKVREIIEVTGSPFTYKSLPDAAHAMHDDDPPRFDQALKEWARGL